MRPDRLIAMGITAALLAAACAPGPASTTTATSAPASQGAASATPSSAPVTLQDKLDRLSTMSGADRRQFLLAEAAKAGPVVMYSTTSPEMIAAWQKAVSADFPTLNIQLVRATPTVALEKLYAESAAGRPVASVAELDAAAWADLLARGHMARYKSPEAATFDPSMVDPNGYYTNTNSRLMVLAYNTTLVKPQEIPATLEGLTAPSFKGRLARTGVGGGTRWIAGVLKAYGEAKGMTILKDLAAQQPRLFDSNSALTSALVSGQVPIIFDTQIDGIEQAKQKGAPVAWTLLEPVFTQPQSVGITKDAQNPYGAALLVDWILARDGGQKIFPQFLFNGARSDMEYPFSAAAKQAKNVIVYSPQLVADPKRYETIFLDLFQRK